MPCPSCDVTVSGHQPWATSMNEISCSSQYTNWQGGAQFRRLALFLSLCLTFSHKLVVAVSIRNTQDCRESAKHSLHVGLLKIFSLIHVHQKGWEEAGLVNMEGGAERRAEGGGLVRQEGLERGRSIPDESGGLARTKYPLWVRRAGQDRVSFMSQEGWPGQSILYESGGLARTEYPLWVRRAGKDRVSFMSQEGWPGLSIFLRRVAKTLVIQGPGHSILYESGGLARTEYPLWVRRAGQDRVSFMSQ